MLNEEQDKELFDSIARHYARKDMLPATIIPRRYQLMVAMRPLLRVSSNPGNVLDVGCGIAAAAHYLHGSYEHYTGIDHSAEMVRLGRDFHRDRNHVDLIQADILDIDLPASSFDLVLCIGALHHLSDAGAVLRRLHLFARPGASIVVIEPQSGNPLVQSVRVLRKKLDRSYSHDQHFFRKSELEVLFRDNGYEHIECKHQGYFSKPFGQIILPLQPIARLVSYLTVLFDSVLDRYMPPFLQFLSWDIILWARFPEARFSEARFSEARSQDPPSLRVPDNPC